MIFRLIVLLLLFVQFFTSCKQDENKDVKVTDITVEQDSTELKQSIPPPPSIDSTNRDSMRR
jgi:hypothetical protein